MKQALEVRLPTRFRPKQALPCVLQGPLFGNGLTPSSVTGREENYRAQEWMCCVIANSSEKASHFQEALLLFIL